VTLDDSGTLLISGFSPSILKYIMEGTEISTWNILLEIINSDRYKKITEILN
jgi:hypothetical protein